MGNILKVVVKIERLTKRPAIFYWDEYGELTCYTPEEGHYNADYSYYKTGARKPKTDEERENLVKSYKATCKVYDDVELRIMTRLSRG